MADWPAADYLSECGRVRLYRGRCEDVLRHLLDGCIDAVLTDPPYGTGEWVRGESGAGRIPKARHHKADWDAWSTDWLDDSRRVCSGPLAFFLATRNLGDAIRYADAAGEPWRTLAWCKTDPMPMFTGQVAYGYEPVMLLRHKQARGGRDWIDASTPRLGRDNDATGHPHQKPMRAALWLAAMMPTGLLLDPFMGSGTFGVAALAAGLSFVGIERDPAHFATARRRIERALAEPNLFATVKMPEVAPRPDLFSGAEEYPNDAKK